MKKHLFKMTRWFVFFVLYAVLNPGLAKAQSDPTKDEILDYSFQNLCEIKTIQFTLTCETKIVFDDLALNHLQEKIKDIKKETIQKGFLTFAASGEKFKSTSILESDQKTQKTDMTENVVAFDGKNYQLFSPNADRMSVSKSPLNSNPDRMFSVLTLPYMWLLHTSSSEAFPVWSEMKNKNLWDYCRNKGTCITSQNIDEHSTVGIEFQSQMRSVVEEDNSSLYVQVYFATDLDYFPIKWQVVNKINDEIVGRAQVNDFLKTNVDGNDFYFPVKMTNRVVMNDFVMESVLTTDPDSIKINEAIDPDFFTISSSQVKHIDDFDAWKKERNGGEVFNVPRDWNQKWFRIILVTVGLLLIIYGVAGKYCNLKK